MFHYPDKLSMDPDKSRGEGIVSSYRQNGLVFLVLENQDLRTTILPAIGGRMVELRRKETGTQFLLQPVYEYSETRLPKYGANYYDYELGGLDDCFPTVTASVCSRQEDTGQDTTLQFPDHGELWSIPWEYHIAEDAVHLSVKGVRHNYEFSKTIRLHNSTVHIEYRVINFSKEPFPYIWSAHPLLTIRTGDRIILDEKVKSVMIDWASSKALGKFGDVLPWPWLSERHDTNYAVISSYADRFAMKLYTDAQTTGYCGYVKSDTSEELVFNFDPQAVPYVGVLLKYKDKHDIKGQPLSILSLQPSRGRPDSLQQACSRQEHTVLEAFGMDEWSLGISMA